MPDPAPSAAFPASSDAALLGPDDPPPFEILQPQGRAPLLIICDHASRAIPRVLGRLGLDETLLMRHIGWDIGAAEVIDRNELAGPAKPLAKERWAGGIDSVGSTTLANLLSMTKYGGAVAACGLAQGLDLPASVAPFILRGISLLGIDSVYCPQAIRRQAWRRLAADLDRNKLAAITTEVPLAKVIEVGPEILAGKVRGRIVVRISG